MPKFFATLCLSILRNYSDSLTKFFSALAKFLDTLATLCLPNIV